MHTSSPLLEPFHLRHRFATRIHTATLFSRSTFTIGYSIYVLSALFTAVIEPNITFFLALSTDECCEHLKCEGALRYL